MGDGGRNRQIKPVRLLHPEIQIQTPEKKGKGNEQVGAVDAELVALPPGLAGMLSNASPEQLATIANMLKGDQK